MRQFHPALLLVTLLLFAPVLTAGGILEATTLDGERVRLSDYLERGRPTLVMVWTTYCAVCASEFPRIEALHRAHAKGDLKVLGLAIGDGSTHAEVRAALARHGASFQSLLATREELAAGYHRYTGNDFTGTPTYLLFDGAGELAAHVTGRLDIVGIEDLLAGGG